MKVNWSAVVLLLLVAITRSHYRNETVEEEEERVNQWLTELDKSLVERMYQDSEASWKYEANLTDFNYAVMNNLSLASASYYKVSISLWVRWLSVLDYYFW